MSKARNLASLISAGSSLADGTVEAEDITDITASAAEINHLTGVTSAIQTQLDAKATPSYVDTAIDNLTDTAPEALDTLNELAAALGDDQNFSSTVTNSLATKITQEDLKASFAL